MTSDILPPTQLSKRKKEMDTQEDELNPLATYPGTENLRPELLNRLNTLILKKREVEEQDQFLRIMNKDVLLTGTNQAVELNSVSKMDPKHKNIDKVMVDSARKIQTEFLAVKKVRQKKLEADKALAQLALNPPDKNLETLYKVRNATMDPASKKMQEFSGKFKPN